MVFQLNIFVTYRLTDSGEMLIETLHRYFIVKREELFSFYLSTEFIHYWFVGLVVDLITYSSRCRIYKNNWAAETLAYPIFLIILATHVAQCHYLEQGYPPRGRSADAPRPSCQ